MWINSFNGFNPYSASMIRHYHFHFKDGLAETKGDKMTCPGSCSQNRCYYIPVL